MSGGGNQSRTHTVDGEGVTERFLRLLDGKGRFRDGTVVVGGQIAARIQPKAGALRQRGLPFVEVSGSRDSRRFW